MVKKTKKDKIKFDDNRVKRSQAIVDASGDEEFIIDIKNKLHIIDLILSDYKNGIISEKVLIDKIKSPLMEIKTNSVIFNYSLIGKLADIMFNFLDHVHQADSTVISIIRANYQTTIAILGNKLKGDGGVYGAQLEKELKEVCAKYLGKQKNT